jgi:hypothetical protein
MNYSHIIPKWYLMFQIQMRVTVSFEKAVDRNTTTEAYFNTANLIVYRNGLPERKIDEALKYLEQRIEKYQEGGSG